MQEEKIRYYFVDGIRGVAIINMVIFHFLYDVYIVYEKSPTWYSLPAIHIWQQAICCTFIFISGFVWVWGKEKNLRRGIIFNLLGLLISIITLVAIPAQIIWNIKFYGLCNPSYASFRKTIKENPCYLWNGNLLFAVPALQTNTIWSNWNNRFATNSSSKSIIQYKNTYTVRLSA